MNATYGVVAITLVCLVTLGIGAFGLRLSRTTSDFYVASRTVSPRWNASAIGGEYLSAASFLGIAGLVYSLGADMLWFPVGYTVGYLVLLVLVAAPLRRSGAYTLPDFAEARLESGVVRRLCAVLVLGIGWLYLLPQFQGAGLALQTVTGAPPWLGGLIVAVVVLANVAAGGMRSITLVQAVQYWLKLTAISVPGVRPALAVDPVGTAGAERARLDLRARVVAPAQRVRWPRPPGLRHLQHPARALLRHDGAAARGGPLLHQPRRARRPAHHPRRRRAARRLLPVHSPLRRPRSDLPAAAARRRARRLRGADAAGGDEPRPARRAAVGAPGRRRVRGVPVDRVAG